MATKYKEYFDRMVALNKDQFRQFEEIHAKYDLEPAKWKAEFDQKGEKILDTIRQWENKLCSQSEKGGYGVYSGKLAEKFWGEVRAKFPRIDDVGVIEEEEENFTIKKINVV